ncbi:hypothetical protein GGD68_004282 [Paraburkholderia fungorum]|jgi:hypothetical protein|uniref:Uncharacterized protein n=1 Tax=Paraburkholderia fungorum TaxID=134537 RepID=A0AAW3UYW9_9BURK|nr:hypothetical protein [Paraburkholderia fungorum]MBB6203441.1 hypothetical protein [Paraburkholderia fungorum]
MIITCQLGVGSCDDNHSGYLTTISSYSEWHLDTEPADFASVDEDCWAPQRETGRAVYGNRY